MKSTKEMNEMGKVVRTFLSWVFLYIAYLVVGWIGSLLFRFGFWAWGEFLSLSAFLKLIIVCLGGGTFIGIIISSLFYVPVLTITLSEAIARSKCGTRYIVFGTIAILVTGISFLLRIILSQSVNIPSLYVIVYCIILLAVKTKVLEEY